MLHVTVVKAEGKLTDVAVQMLGAGVMIDANDPALHHRKDAFDAVRGHAVADILTEAVVDALLAIIQAVERAIDRRFVGVQGRANFDIVADEAVNRSRRA